jgi:protein involved in polysaccharide export with SLBB domain
MSQDQDSAVMQDDQTSQAPLSADQINSILQQNPDLMTELKSELADHLQQQGVQIDSESISDQTLYDNISTNPSLRASITNVLRARGYVPEGLAASGVSDTNQPLANTTLPSQPSSSSLTPGGAAADQRFSGSSNMTSTDRTSREMFGSTGAGLREPNPQGTLQRKVKSNASTDLPVVVHQPAPYDLEAMHDLYAQLPDQAGRVERFGSDVFVRRDGMAPQRGAIARDTPLDVPLGPDYVVGPGDGLTIELWGGTTQSITRTVDRDGRIFLPEAGALQVAGLALGKVQGLIEGALRQQYRNAQVAVTVSSLRSVRVYVVGDVQRPGGYDISSLATPLSLLFAAGGPTAAGSLRTALHYRGKELVEKIDLYDFLLHGVRNGTAPFQSGDTLLVPPAGPQIAVLGAVRRPAIYELNSHDATLATLIDDAGGSTAAASLSHIRIERIDARHERETVTLPESATSSPEAAQEALAAFRVQDGDRIHVELILPYSQRAVYLAGHVVRPGRVPYTDGMRLTDVLRSYRDMLPEPADRGEIVRLVPPDLHPETIDFNVPDVLIGNADVDLRPFDTIRILGRYQADAPTVTIRGEVLRPGKYPMARGMTAAQLVRMAGGFKRDALRDSADLTSYDVQNGTRVVEALSTVRIGDAVTGANPKADVSLKPDDILSIHQITSWNDIGESVTIRGQVRFPGNYGFTDGERLSSVLRRAGGLLPTAYPIGAVLVRVQVRELEQQSRDELIRQIETNSAAARLSPGIAGSNSAGALQLIKAQQDQVLGDLKAHPPTGRMVIHISADIDSWANTQADIELRRGDVLTIPRRPGFVLVSGQVYNATALTFSPGKTAEWYLSRAGGTNATANRKEVFIIRANGSVVGRRSGGWFNGDVLSTKLDPGDVIVVPQKIIGGSLFWRNLLSTGQLAASVAITAGVATAAL